MARSSFIERKNDRAPEASALVVLFAALLAPLIAFGSPEVIWMDVPFVKQNKNACGAASISMLMRYWQEKLPGRSFEGADPAEIEKLLYSEQARGIYASAVKQYLEQQGFQVFIFRGTWDDLSTHLQKGRPLIAAIHEGRLHYVLVTGIEPQGGTILLNDPARKKLSKMSRSDFEQKWSDTDQWTLLAIPSPN